MARNMTLSVALRRIVRMALYLMLSLAVPPWPAAAIAQDGFSEGEAVDLPDAVTRDDALLTILYTASTYGELHPCPT
jgi:hypothetical protein